MTYYPYYQPQSPQNQFYGAQGQGQVFVPAQPQMAQNGAFNVPQTAVPQFSSGQNINTIEYVNGIEGAKAYIMQPNSVKWLMDSDGSYFYLKTSNAQNQASVKMFEYKEIDVATKKALVPEIDVSLFVKKEEFDALKKTVASLKRAKSLKLVGDDDE